MNAVTVTLAKEWGDRLAGSTVEVDPERAVALEAAGFVGAQAPPDATPKQDEEEVTPPVLEVAPVVGICELCGEPWPHGHTAEQIAAWENEGGSDQATAQAPSEPAAPAERSKNRRGNR